MDEDFEIVDDSDFEVMSEQPQEKSEYGLMWQPGPDTDVGPPSDGVPEESLSPRNRSMPERLARGVLSAAPFKEEIGGAVEAIGGAVSSSGDPILDAYRKSREGHREFWENERLQNDTAGKVGNVVGSIPFAVASSAALPGGLAATGAKAIGQGAIMGGVQGLDDTRADLTKGQIGKASEDVASGAGIGAAASYAIPKLLSGAMAPIRSVGEKLQLGQRAKDFAADTIGKYPSIAKLLGGNTDDVVDDTLASQSTKYMKQAVADADTFKPTPVNFGKDSRTHWLGATDPSKLSPDERAAYNLAIEQFEGRATGDAASDVFTTGRARDLADIHADVSNEAVKRHFPELEDFTEPLSEASRLAKSASADPTAAAARNAKTAPAGQSPTLSSNTRSTQDEAARYAQLKSDISSAYEPRELAIRQRASTLSGQMSEADQAVARDIVEKFRLQQEAKTAQGALQQRQLGDKALRNITGSGIGAAIGGSVGGAPGAAIGAGLGGKLGSKALGIADLAGTAGQRLSLVASWGDRLALRDDVIGDLAKAAMSASGQNAAALWAILAQQPGIDEAIEQ